MDYEKLYKEALERATKLAFTGNISATAAGEIFHELRDSEDEKIRKAIIEHYRGMHSAMFLLRGLSREEYIAWLEKQGKQKPVEQDPEIRDSWVYIEEWNKKFGRLPKDVDELAACIDYVMKRQKPADKIENESIWNEEDEKTIRQIERIINNCASRKLREKIHNWLKAIKPQNRWKPSEQNIKDLEWCADLVKDKMGVGFHRLQVFIDELKTL